MKLKASDVRYWIAKNRPAHYVDLYIIESRQINGYWLLSDLNYLLPNDIINTLKQTSDIRYIF